MIVSFEPGLPVPVVLIGVRDEFLERPWVGPGHHWSQRPDLIGGMDLRAGGTWLAVNEIRRRVACVLNGQGQPAQVMGRRSRGELPLVLGSGLTLPKLDRFDPCHLVSATLDRVALISWNGVQLTQQELAPGLHFIVNSGLEAVESGPEDMRHRIAYFRPRLLSVPRPSPKPDAQDIYEAWGSWLSIVDGDGLDPADPRALVVRREFDDQMWGTNSISLVALRPEGVRYDFIDKNS